MTFLKLVYVTTLFLSAALPAAAQTASAPMKSSEGKEVGSVNLTQTAQGVLINVMTPDFYGAILQYDLTKWGLGLAGAWMLMGNIVMFKMCNFRI